MSIDATRWAWKKDCSSPMQKIVLLSLADRANEQNYCYPSFDRLMKDTGSSRSSIIRSLLALEGLGFIARIHRKNDKGNNTSNAYQLIGVENREGKVIMAYDTMGGCQADTRGSVTVTLGGCQADTMGGCHSDTGGSVTVTPKSTSLNLPSFEPTKETHSKEKQTATEKANEAHASSVSVQQVVDLYHEILPSLPSVLKVTDARRKAISARIHDDLKTPSEWRVFFSRVGKSDFLTGKVDGFRADLEWLCKPANMLKVLEGRYERNQAKPVPPQSKHNGFAQRDYSKGINPDGSF